jgi:PadR family transcriptional regulator AphA
VSAELTTNDLTVLSLVAERPTHGWALAAKLAHGAEIGQVHAISRPVVYHALARLEDAGLVHATGLERGGRGPHRVVYAATPEGKRELVDWLSTPAEHVRDIRSLLLLKVVLSERAGIDPEPLLVAQRAVLLPFVGWLEAQLDDPAHELPGEAAVAAFRLETATAILRFIDAQLDGRGATSSRSSGSAPRSAHGRR